MFTAVLSELVESGYSRLSMESVAKRAGVHKTTVYRRWETVDSLLSEALRSFASEPVVPDDTGSLEGDLVAYARAIIEVLTGPAGAIIAAALGSEAASVAGVQEVKDMIFSTRRPLSAQIIARAIARNEVPAGSDAEEIIDHLTAPIYFRLILSGKPLDEELARRTGRATAVAARAGVFVGD